jgi:cyanophycinase
MNRIPKGTLLLIGGAEDKGEGVDIERRNKNYRQFEILDELLPKKRTGKKTIEIITTASTDPYAVNESYKTAFKKIGFKHIGFIYIGNSLETHNPYYLERIRKAHAVLFSGGHQFRLSTILGNSDVMRAIHHRYMEDPDFIVAGTSAGAMSLGVLMMYEGENNEAMLAGAVKISSGLGIIERCLIDTHFIKRGRFGRLTQAVVMNPACVGIGLGEDTAMVVKKGYMMECRGSGMVVIIDAEKVGHTNVAYAETDTPVCVENLKVHILAEGNKFDLKNKIFFPAPKDLKYELVIEQKNHPGKPRKTLSKLRAERIKAKKQTQE